MKNMKTDNTNQFEQPIMLAPSEATSSSILEGIFGLETVSNLLSALKHEGVNYCHWKSNIRLDEAVYGKTDLDLLVDEQHLDVFKRILDKFDVKPILSAPGKDYPGIENFLGFDATTGNLFHLHVHYQLVLGEQYVKNYWLPLETHLLESVRQLRSVQIPAPEMELIVFCIRALLKYRDRDGIKDIFTIRSPGLPIHVIQEAKWLLAQTTFERVSQTMQKLGSQYPADIILNFLHIASNSPRDGYQLLILRTRLRRALRPFQRHSRYRASLIYFRELWRQRKSFLRFRVRQKMKPSKGGRSLALIGIDGAGKSAMTQSLHKWLAWKLDVERYYLGSKQPSRLSELLYLLFRMTRRSHRACVQLLGEKSLPSSGLAALRQTLLYSHDISIGYDRLRCFRASQAKAAAGTLVIYDRFPMAASLDGPKIQSMAKGNFRRLTHAFRQWENHIYRKFTPPDYLFLLDVNPEVSIQRKPDHDISTIKAKHLVLKGLLNSKTGGLDAVLVDANQPFEEVELNLKEAVWQVL